MYAVMQTGGKQYRVTAGETLEIERLEAEEGSSITIDQVLLVNTDGTVRIGTPTVAGASIVADVVAHKRGDKVVAFKMKRRKGYHRKVGHRQELSVVRVRAINDGAGATSEAAAAHAKKAKAKVEVEPVQA